MEGQPKTEYDIALEQYSETLKVLNLKEEDIYIFETNKYPMHPSTFYQLNEFSHFSNLSNKIYEDYLTEWSKKYEIN